jgi:glutamate-1-semialdehyde 2,1-aminomutase
MPGQHQFQNIAKRLEDGLRTAATESGIEHCLNRVGSMLTLFFQAGPVTDWNSASKCDTEKFSKYFWGLIHRGVYMPCSQFEALFISATHTDEHIDQTIEAARDVFQSWK